MTEDYCPYFEDNFLPVPTCSPNDMKERLKRFSDGSSGDLSFLNDTSATWSQAFRFLGSAGNTTDDIVQTVSLRWT